MFNKPCLPYMGRLHPKHDKPVEKGFSPAWAGYGPWRHPGVRYTPAVSCHTITTCLLTVCRPSGQSPNLTFKIWCLRRELSLPAFTGRLRQSTIKPPSELLMRIELTTSSLPRKCSTPELQQQGRFPLPVRASVNGYDERRTRFELATFSLEG